MPLVRDAMMCCYECYRIPNPGQHDLRRTDESEVQLARPTNRKVSHYQSTNDVLLMCSQYISLLEGNDCECRRRFDWKTNEVEEFADIL